MAALGHYDNNEFDEALKEFDGISDTSKILFNCGVIHATLGEHEKAVRVIALHRRLGLITYRSSATKEQSGWTNTWLWHTFSKVYRISWLATLRKR